MYMLPPLPCVDAPVDILIVPLAPLLAVPDRNDSAPLVPVTPAFVVFNTTSPELFADPYPEDKDSEPPLALVPCPPESFMCPPKPTLELLERPAVIVIVPPTKELAVVSPATSNILPPFSDVPLPTFKLISPPFPFVADPVLYEI